MSVNSKMTAIADAIRAKTGGTGLLTLDDMAQDIAAIDTSENLDDVLDEQDALIADIKSTLAEKGVKPEQTKTATPSLSQQTIVPDSGKTLSGVTVEPITATLLTSLDADFNPENIAKDANLFGLIGTHEGGGTPAAYGTITGSGSATQTISGLPFTPTRIIIMQMDTTPGVDFPESAPTATIQGAYATKGDYAVGYFNDSSNSAVMQFSATFAANSISLTRTFSSSSAKWSGTYMWIVVGE